MRLHKMILITLPVCILFTSLCTAQDDKKAFYIGHSLSDQIPDMVKSLADDYAGISFDWVYQSIPGSPLSWQWDRMDANDYSSNPPYYFGFYDNLGGLPVGDFDLLVLTESVPRYEAIIDLTYQYADSFYVYAYDQNPNTRIYLYEVWHCLLSGTPTGCDYDIDANSWRERIDDDLPMWESVVDTLNARFNPTTPVCLIPAGQGLARVKDSIDAGVMPGLTTIEDLFSDNIHLTDIGKYFVACVHFATIYERSPVGLTNQLQVWWGGDFEAPSEQLALKFQEIAWQTAIEYPNSCVEAELSVSGINPLMRVNVFPNPSLGDFTITFSETITDGSIEIKDVLGKTILTEEILNQKMSIQIDEMPGLYFLTVYDQHRNHQTHKIIVE